MKFRKRITRELFVCQNDSFPPLPLIEHNLLCEIEEMISKQQTNLISQNKLFEGRTFTKKGRFEILSSLVKSRAIYIKKITDDILEITLRPNITTINCNDIMCYEIKNKMERHNLLRLFSH